MDETRPADWLRQARDRFYEETKGLTDEQVIAYIRERAASVSATHDPAAPAQASSRSAA